MFLDEIRKEGRGQLTWRQVGLGEKFHFILVK